MTTCERSVLLICTPPPPGLQWAVGDLAAGFAPSSSLVRFFSESSYAWAPLQSSSSARSSAPPSFAASSSSAPSTALTFKPLSCTCRKNRCLKLYCVCFEGGASCGESCKCITCGNTDNDTRRERKPPSMVRCNCRKTRCSKMYCECYRAGLACGPLCGCQGCSNSLPAWDTCAEECPS